MRKETTARLLLSLFTAFIMVAGAFGAALPTLTEDWAGEESKMPSVVSEAGSVNELEMGGTGDDPVSAITGRNRDEQTQEASILFENEQMNLNGDMPYTESIEKTKLVDSPDSLGRDERGTRNPDTLDANGPYGTISDPEYEGNPITFTATIEPEDEQDNYQFRWDADGDGTFDGPGDEVDEYFGEYGENEYTMMFLDDAMGEALVQAWDGSWTTITTEGRVLDGLTDTNYYYSGYSSWSNGWTFTVNQEVQVTQLGCSRASSLDPYYYYNIRLWEYPTILAQVDYPNPPTGTWEWHDITPVTLYPSITYCISAYVYYYYMGTTVNMPSTSADGIVEPDAAYYRSGNNYPVYYSMNEWPLLDINYEYEITVPNVLEDTAELFVLNRVPTVTEAIVNPSETREGAKDASFTGSLIDLGEDDEWWYQWDFGDGTQSDWLPVPKWSGGIKLLFLHGCSTPGYGFFDDFVPSLLDVMGPNVIQWEEYDYEFRGHSAAPDLDYLLQFDVIYHAGFSVGTGGGLHAAVGDVLADACDAGVGVVQLANTFYDIADYGTEGRWRDERYELLQAADVLIGSNQYSYNMDWWDTHTITDGPFGTLTAASAFIIHDTYASTMSPWANLLATWDAGPVALAYADEGHHGIPGSGRIVAYNTYPFTTGYYTYNAGDYVMLVANALMWASQQPLAEKLSQPLPLPPISHVYADDHPVHITPSDEVQPSVRVKDDDHGKMIALPGVTFLWEESDWPGSGTYYPGEYSGWTDEHKSIIYYYGWWRSSTANSGGSPYEARLTWAYAVANMHFYSAAFDTTAYGLGTLEFKSFIDHYSGSGYYTLCAGVSTDASTWTTVWSVQPSGNNLYDVSVQFPAGSPTTYIGFWCEGDPFYFDYWYIDDVEIYGQESWGPVEGMSDWMDTPDPITVINVFPEAANAKNIVLDQDENTPLTFEGFNIVDPAFATPTEEFWYRWDFDDGTVTDWAPGGEVKGVLESVIYLHTYYDAYGYYVDNIIDELQAELGPSVVIDERAFIDFAGNVPDVPTLAEIEDYDVAIFDIELNWYSATGTQLCNDMGDLLADYADTFSPSSGRPHGVVQINSLAPDQWGLHGRWEAEGYNAIENSAAIEEVNGPYRDMGTVYEPSHPIMDAVSAITTYHRCPCDSERAGATLLADYDCGYKFAAAWGGDVPENPSQGGTVALNFQPHDGLSGDGYRMFANAIRWTAVGKSPELDPIDHNFMDNGRYDVYLQIIDDDMYWDLSGPQPVFLGPDLDPNTQDADPFDWIGGTVFTANIDNTDPVISPRMRAYAQLDLRLRVSGTKDTDATMTLYETVGDETTVLGTASVTRDPGAPDIGIMPSVELLLNKENTYELVVQVTGGSGGNPTWIFDMVFPDGKFKEFKHTFNDEHGWTWVIDNSMLKGALLGHDIIFEAEADDRGSDDLAFVWNFGDSTPHGIHLYANVDQGTAVDAVSDEATVIFDQLPDRDDFFDKDLNDVRTPYGTPISIGDTISHVFDDSQPYYYYVTLVVMDDDVGDDYPSTQLHPCPGCDMAFLELDFR